MSRNAVIVHGKPKIERYLDPEQPKPHEANWLPWAKAHLERAGIPTRVPALPVPYAPQYDAWQTEVGPESITRETTVVGLSAGAGFILRLLSRNSFVRPDKVVLVAPWLDPNRKYGDFGEFKIDPKLVERCAGGLAVFYSSEDDEQAQKSLEVVRQALPGAKYIDIPEYGHFMIGNTMTGPEFPELLDEVL